MFTSYQLRQDWTQDLPKYWCNNNPFRTHFLNAMSAIFPEGEKFFIDSVKPFKDSITDPKLKAEIDEFIKQENWHGYAHKQYNEWLENQSLPADHAAQEHIQRLSWIKRHFSIEMCLAITVGLEHITALTGGYNLRKRSFMKRMHPHFETLWRWHSVEEVEHKAVCFDLWRSINGKESTRQWAMIFATMFYWWTVGKATIQFLHADRQLFKWATLKDAWQFIFAKEGMVRENTQKYFSYFRKDFHPNDHDDSLLLRFRKT
jgi:predicted metal-dependent hydrolase